MKPIRHILQTNTKIRYVVIGGLTFLVELFVIFLAQSLGASGTIAVAISFLTGLGISFLLQKVVTFQDKRFHKKLLASQLAAYSILVAFNFTFTLVMVHIFQDYFPVAAIRTVTLAITVIWNFYLYKTWIFRQKSA